jgi:hypothetical protein
MLQKKSSKLDRREAVQTDGTTVALAAASGVSDLTATLTSRRYSPMPNAHLAVSLSHMFEGGGQPIPGAGGVIVVSENGLNRVLGACPIDMQRRLRNVVRRRSQGCQGSAA